MEKIIIFISLIFFFVSCTRNEDVGVNDNISVKDKEVEVARNAIKAFIKSGIETKSDLLDLSPLSLKESKSIDVIVESDYQTKESIDVFVFDLVEGSKKGYAIASGDERISSVYAFVEDGELSDTTYILGLKILLSQIPDLVKEDLSSYYKKSMQQIDEVYTTSSSYTGRALLKTQWGQWAPYNATCSVKNETCKPPAGCSAIALAQVLAYLNKPSSRFRGTFNYTSLTSTPKGTNLSTASKAMLAKFVHYCGDKMDMDYKCGSSGAWPQDFSDFAKLGFITSYTKQYTMVRVTENIAYYGYPQIMVAFRTTTEGKRVGHTWVVDGFEGRVTNGLYQNFYHMNFGWSGTDDGWFRISPTFTSIPTQNGTYGIESILYFEGFTAAAETDNLIYDGPVL